MVERLLGLRFIFLIPIGITFINCLFFIWLGIEHAYHGYVIVIEGHTEARPGLAFLESLDMFMVALVFMVFSFGMLRIFTHYDVKEDKLPGWMQIRTFKELKILLWETVLVTLVILSISVLIQKLDNPSWELLVLPGMILILSLALFLMRKEEGGHP